MCCCQCQNPKSNFRKPLVFAAAKDNDSEVEGDAKDENDAVCNKVGHLDLMTGGFWDGLVDSSNFRYGFIDVPKSLNDFIIVCTLKTICRHLVKPLAAKKQSEENQKTVSFSENSPLNVKVKNSSLSI